MDFEEKKRLQNIYDAEVTQRLLNPSESKVYSELTRQKHPDISLNTFGCVELLPFIKLEFKNQKPIEIMDFGCGAGSDLALYHRELQISRAVGIEISKKMLSQALTLSEPIEWINGDHFDLMKLDQKFDCITSNAVIHLIRNKSIVLKNIFSKLKKQGVLISAEFVTSKPLPPIFMEHYKESDGLFLFGGLIDRTSYLNLHFEANFEEVEILKRIKFDPKPQIKNLLLNARPKNYQEMMKSLDEIAFEILVTRSQKELASEQVAYQCVKCGALQVASNKFYRSLNCQVHKNLVKLMHETQWSKCENCKTEQFIAPFQIHEMQNKKMAFCFPSSMENDKHKIQRDILAPFMQRLPHYKMLLCFYPNQLNTFLYSS
ncbi:MAG: methyltransferase domain-containing protein [bacterium]|nr:methyltransferase domain-containing protein [bacterium]